MSMLRAKLYTMQMEEQAAKLASARKMQARCAEIYRRDASPRYVAEMKCRDMLSPRYSISISRRILTQIRRALSYVPYFVKMRLKRRETAKGAKSVRRQQSFPAPGVEMSPADTPRSANSSANSGRKSPSGGERMAEVVDQVMPRYTRDVVEM